MRGSLAARRPSWPVAALSTMTAAVFLSVSTELLPTGLLPAMSRDLQVSPGRLGLLVTAFALTVALFAMPLGMAVGRIPRRTLLVASLLGYALCNAVTAFSDSYPLTFAARMVGGLTHGVFWGMLGGYVGRIVPPERVGRALTLLSAGGTAAVLFGVPAGTALGVAVGWRATFALCAVVAVAMALLAIRLLPPVAGSTAVATMRLRQVVRLPGLAVPVIVTGVTMLGHFSFSTYVAPFLLHAGLSEAGIGPALAASGLLGVLGLAATGALVDRRPRQATLAASATLVTAFAVLAVFGSSAVPAVVAGASTGLALGALPVLLQTATLRAAPQAAEQASALQASAFNVGIGGGGLLGGAVLDHWGAGALPVLACALTAVGFAVIAFNPGPAPAPVAAV